MRGSLKRSLGGGIPENTPKVGISLLLINGGAVKHDAPELPFAIGLPFDNPKVLQAHLFNPAA